jgi:hypothetical protein
VTLLPRKQRLPYLDVFKRVADYLQTMLQNTLQEAVEDPAHAPPAIKDMCPGEAAKQCFSQLQAYWCRDYPFHRVPAEEGDSLVWWQNVEQFASAKILAMLAIKLFSITVNSMADERTNSTLTWFNSPLRGRQDVQTIRDMLQVGQYSIG